MTRPYSVFCVASACVIDLQKRLDDLAERQSSEDDRMLVFEARSAIWERERRLTRARDALGG